MNLTPHLDALRDRHREIDEQLSEEHQRPQPNYETVTRLKQRKLQIKDEIERLSSL